MFIVRLTIFDSGGILILITVNAKSPQQLNVHQQVLIIIPILRCAIQRHHFNCNTWLKDTKTSAVVFLISFISLYH
jgi:hypothetical protein